MPKTKETRDERAFREQWGAMVSALAIAFNGDRERAEECLKATVRKAFGVKEDGTA